MSRIFALGTVSDRKLVVIEVKGARLSVMRMAPDGKMERGEKELKSEAEAQRESDRLIRDLTSRGYVERTDPPSREEKPQREKSKSSRSVRSSTRTTEPVPKSEKSQRSRLFDDEEEESPALTNNGSRAQHRAESPAVEEDDLVLPARLAGLPRAESTENSDLQKAAKKKKRRKKKGKNGNDLDKRVIALVAAGGAALAIFLGAFLYDAFLKPPILIGTWEASLVEYEFGQIPMKHEYRLVLDDKHRASWTQGMFGGGNSTSVGTYTVQGKRLQLTLREQDEDGKPSDEPFEKEYRISLGRVTLDLFEPDTGKKVVQLLRMREKPRLGPSGGGGGSEAPAANLTVDVSEKGDEGSDASLASVQFSPKDGAFRMRHPKGWEVETGSRADNIYSWARFTHGSAKIQVYADVAGSLMSGAPNVGNLQEGSDFAPVHRAHEMYQKTASEMYSDYKEGAPTVFKGSTLGEGRIAAYTASTGGLFGSKVSGYRVTLLSNDRRISVLCHCPGKDFTMYKPTFLAVCRSLGH